MNDIEPIYIFVYGTLKSSKKNNHILNSISKMVGKAQTIDTFCMFYNEFGNYPMLIDSTYENLLSAQYSSEFKKQVEGELYIIQHKENIKILDDFEGTPQLFFRKKIKIHSIEENKEILAYTYFLAKKQMFKLKKSDKPIFDF